MYRATLSGALLLGFAACSGDDESATTTGTDTASTTPSAVFFLSEVDTGKISGGIDGATVRAHRSMEFLNASFGVLISDPNVRSRLTAEDGTRAGLCWTYLSPPRSEFTIDFTGCDAVDMSGGIFVKDHPSGPLLFEFQAFEIAGRTMSGTVGLDALDGDGVWRIYNTDTISPGVDNKVPIGVTIDGFLTGMDLDGSGVLKLGSETTWDQWVNASFTDAYLNTVDVTQGAESAEDVDPTTNPNIDTRVSIPTWLDCRCPLSGQTQYDAVFSLDEITIDIDDLQDGDDGFDDPEITLPVSQTLEGLAVAEATGCGEWDLAFPVDDGITVNIDKQQFLSLLNIQCDTLAIPNRAHCDALLFAAEALEGGIAVDVGAAKLRNQADKAFEDAVGGGFCSLN